MIAVVFILLFLVLLFFIARPLTVLLHELGHAIPAILLTKQKVTIYIGSYGDPKKSIKLNAGKLEVYFHYNPFFWKLGLCVPGANDISLNRQIVYTITGPITSLLVASLACYFAFAYEFPGIVILFFLVFLASAVFDLYVNLVPDPTPIKLFDGNIAYNDGYNLKLLFYYKRLPKEYIKATDLYYQKRYSEAAAILNKLLSGGENDENIYRLAINSYLQDKNYVKGKELSEEFMQSGKMNSDDYSWLALSYSQLKFYDKAIEYYYKSLQENPNQVFSLNNIGFTLNLLARYEEAIPFFDKAIELEKDPAYAYNNRGLAKIKTGKTEDGLKDINYSFELEKDNSYNYRNLGIYHFERGDYKEAFELFTRAKELDSSTHMIDELIAETRQLLR